jgi:metal-responsive CopG/Arc/MetJ family transcriptional regulator
VIATRLAQGMIVKVDKWAEGKDLSRSEAIRALIERGLKQK